MADNTPREGDQPPVTSATAETTAPPATDPGPVAQGFGFKVRVEHYFGPLDLLLHLVKEAEVDITRITLAGIAEQYIAYLAAMQKLDIELAGEFLVIASQLLLIKSRTLAPPPEGEAAEGEEDEEEAADNSLELIKKLLDYKRFKDRAKALDRMWEERSRRFERPRVKIEGAPEPEPEPLRDMELWDLVLLYSKVIKSVGFTAGIQILYRDVPLEVYFESILQLLAGRRSMDFRELLEGENDRIRTVGTFLAILQLARDGRLSIVQDEDLGTIRIEYREAPASAPEAGDRGSADGSTRPPAEAGSLTASERIGGSADQQIGGSDELPGAAADDEPPAADPERPTIS